MPSAPEPRGDFDNSERESHQTLIDKIVGEWRLLWHDRIEDKIRAEGIANRDYSSLFVDQGTVIAATRDFKPLNFKEILRLHKILKSEHSVSSPPSVGGWTKFARTVLNKQKRVRKWKEPPCVLVRSHTKKLQLRKGGRGWLHQRIDW